MQDIRQARKTRGLSLQQLAVLAEVSYPYLSGVERGVHPLSATLAERLAPALGVLPADLLTAHVVLREQLRREIREGRDSA